MRSRKPHNQPARRPSDEAGFAMIEVAIGLAILAIGVLGMILGFDSSRRLSLVSERHATMAHVAQREIERLEGTAYSQLGLTSTPGTSSSPSNPDYYVSGGSPPTLQWDRTTGSTEQLDIDTTNGTIAHIQSWTEGQLTGQIYDFVTWTTDPKCSPGCPASNDYKRITVAVTVGGGLQPDPVYVSSVVSDPQSIPTGGIQNGNTGNPLTDPSTKCINGAGQTVLCTSGIDSGNPNAYFLHDWAATNSGTPPAPSANHTTDPTVGTISGLTCTQSQNQTGTPSNVAGCPVPDLMDNNPPAGTTSSPLYFYSTDQGTSGYPGGRLLQPTCSNPNNGCGTGSTSDCNNGQWTNSLSNTQSEFWVTRPLSQGVTLTGDGGLSIFTQTQNNTNAVVSFCVEVYDVPPSGSNGSLKDLLVWQPVALGGAGYVAATDPVTHGNWPLAADQVTFTFNFRGSNGSIDINGGDRIGFRVWMKSSANSPINLIYDNPNYPSQVQLNTA